MKQTIKTIALAILILGHNAISLASKPYETSTNYKPKLTWIGAGSYAACDFAGAAQGFRWGSIGGTMGMALGIVVGGAVTSTWMYMERHDHGSIPLVVPTDPSTTGYSNDYEQAGYLHNQFLINFVNASGEIYSTPETFADAIYEPLCQFVSSEYNVNVKIIKSHISKESLIQMIAPINPQSTISDYSNSISNTYGNDHISSEYARITNQLMTITETGLPNSLNYINTEIENINSNQQLTGEEKEIMKYSCNVLKYSLSLWSANE